MARIRKGKIVSFGRSGVGFLFSVARRSSSGETLISSTMVMCGMRAFDSAIFSAMRRRRPTTLTSVTAFCSTSPPPRTGSGPRSRKASMS